MYNTVQIFTVIFIENATDVRRLNRKTEARNVKKMHNPENTSANLQIKQMTTYKTHTCTEVIFD